MGWQHKPVIPIMENGCHNFVSLPDKFLHFLNYSEFRQNKNFFWKPMMQTLEHSLKLSKKKGRGT